MQWKKKNRIILPCGGVGGVGGGTCNSMNFLPEIMQVRGQWNYTFKVKKMLFLYLSVTLPLNEYSNSPITASHRNIQ